MKTIGFMMEIEDVDFTSNRGIFAEGTITKGLVNLGDALEIVGNNLIVRTFIASIEKIEQNNKRTLQSTAQAGDKVRLLLTNSRNDNIQIGNIISTPKAFRHHSKFKAKITLLNDKENENSICEIFNTQIAFRKDADSAINGIFYFLEDENNNATSADDSLNMLILMESPIVVEKDLIFDIYKCTKKVATGIVTEIVE